MLMGPGEVKVTPERAQLFLDARGPHLFLINLFFADAGSEDLDGDDEDASL
jgi:hypothetical protein